MILEVGEESFKQTLAKEYQIQRFETYLPTAAEVFAAFEQKFITFLALLDYFPFFEELMVSGLKMLADDNYSAVEMRLVLGLGQMQDENFQDMSNDALIEGMVRIADQARESLGISESDQEPAS